MNIKELKKIIKNYRLLRYTENQFRLVLSSKRRTSERKSAKNFLVENRLLSSRLKMLEHHISIKSILNFFDINIESLPEYKKNYIKKILFENKSITVISLSQFISESTIRRYIDTFICHLYIKVRNDGLLMNQCKHILKVLEKTLNK